MVEKHDAAYNYRLVIGCGYMSQNVLNLEWIHTFYCINFSNVFDIAMTSSGKGGKPNSHVMHSLLTFFHMEIKCDALMQYLLFNTQCHCSLSALNH